MTLNLTDHRASLVQNYKQGNELEQISSTQFFKEKLCTKHIKT